MKSSATSPGPRLSRAPARATPTARGRDQHLFLGDHDRGRVRVAARNRGHDRRVDHPEARHAAHAELGVDHGERVRAIEILGGREVPGIDGGPPAGNGLGAVHDPAHPRGFDQCCTERSAVQRWRSPAPGVGAVWRPSNSVPKGIRIRPRSVAKRRQSLARRLENKPNPQAKSLRARRQLRTFSDAGFWNSMAPYGRRSPLRPSPATTISRSSSGRSLHLARDCGSSR
jgi:hypothetical protein